MTIKLGYMGTKKFLAPHVRGVISGCKKGAVLDAFAGMCSVGETFADTRQVWVNDIQVFASEVGRALLASSGMPPLRSSIERAFAKAFEENKARLEKRFSPLLIMEKRAISSGLLDDLQIVNQEIVTRTSSSYMMTERKRLTKTPTSLPYRLFTLAYSGRFFSLAQSIEVDSLRFAIDTVCQTLSSSEKRRWLILALGITLIRIASSTGHFAQHLNPKESNLSFILMQRNRLTLDVFWAELGNLSSVGSIEWRKKNRVFNEDAIELLQKMYLFDDGPAVVYADPPYTDDQYSRYYHIWETLVLYDYPASVGKGCYRPDRFRTPFALKAKVEQSIDSLAACTARLGAELVISYPDKGLLSKTSSTIQSILKRHYKHCECAVSLVHSHSTMGASKGHAKQMVNEMIFVARN